jgi:hypothetical protein
MAGCGAPAADGPRATAADHPAHAAHAAHAVAIKRGGVAECETSQLRVFFFAGAAAAGTGLTGIGIANTDARPCWLGGRPEVKLTAQASPEDKRPVTVGPRYDGRTPLLVAHPRRVVLARAAPVPLGTRPYPPVSAGIVVLNRDFPAVGSNCPVVTSMSIRLPGAGTRRYRVATNIWACGQPPSVWVSAVVTRYTMLGQVYTGTASPCQLQTGSLGCLAPKRP